MYQNIPLGDNRDSTKDHPEVGMVVLLIEEILLNHYGIESRDKNLENQLQIAS